MSSRKDPRAPFRAAYQGLLRRRRAAWMLVPLHALLLAGLCAWLASRVLPGLPPLPLWVCLLPLLPGAAAAWVYGSRRARLESLEARDLVESALEVEAHHPYAPSLAARARAFLETRKKELLADSLEAARRPRPWFSLYALLAFLLLLDWTGPLPLPSPLPGPSLAVRGIPPVRQGGGPEGRERQGGKAPLPRPQREDGPGKTARTRRPSPPPPRPRPRPPSRGRRGIRPQEEEKVLFSLPPQGEGPRHVKKVYETEGHPSPPRREGTGRARAGGGSSDPPGPGAPPSSRESRRPPRRPPLARALERAAEKALGDGLLSPGEAWLASRMAEAWKR